MRLVGQIAQVGSESAIFEGRNLERASCWWTFRLPADRAQSLPELLESEGDLLDSESRGMRFQLRVAGLLFLPLIGRGFCLALRPLRCLLRTGDHCESAEHEGVALRTPLGTGGKGRSKTSIWSCCTAASGVCGRRSRLAFSDMRPAWRLPGINVVEACLVLIRERSPRSCQAVAVFI